MQRRRKFFIVLGAVILLLVIYFAIQRNAKPLTRDDTANEVITIIKELDKNPANIK